MPAGDAAGHLALPFDPREAFGRVRAAVVVTVNRHSYRSTVAVMNGETFVPLRRSHREAAGLVAGETVEVALVLDTLPRDVPLPPELAEALDEAGRAHWDALSNTARREIADAITGARRPETRARRVAMALARLRAT